MATNSPHAVRGRPRTQQQERPGPLTIRIANRHRWVGFGAAATAAGSFAALWIPNLTHKVSTGATGASYLVIGLVLSSLLALATASRRGLLMAGAALLVAVGPWGPEYFLQIAFFAYAVFLMVLVARQTRSATDSDNRVASWLSGLRERVAPTPAPATGAGRPRPASSARYAAPKRRRR